jgi:hypothetical protein
MILGKCLRLGGRKLLEAACRRLGTQSFLRKEATGSTGKCVTTWKIERCRRSVEQCVNKGSAVFSSFVFCKCAGHVSEGFRSMHHSFRLEFMFAQSFCLQVSFN